MLHLALALTSFLILHLIPVLPGMRDRMVGRIGHSNYIIIHSIISTATLVWVIYAALNAPSVQLWPVAGWQAWTTLILSPLALFLIAAGLFSPNPLSLSVRRGGKAGQSGIARITRHPVFWGALIWAVSHIPPNGDLRSVILFGSLAILAALGFWLGDRRARRRLGSRWGEMADTTSIVPFAAVIAGRTSIRIDAPIIVGLVVAAGLTGWLLHGGHVVLFGVDPLVATTY